MITLILIGGCIINIIYILYGVSIFIYLLFALALAGSVLGGLCLLFFLLLSCYSICLLFCFISILIFPPYITICPPLIFCFLVTWLCFICLLVRLTLDIFCCFICSLILYLIITFYGIIGSFVWTIVFCVLVLLSIILLSNIIICSSPIYCILFFSCGCIFIILLICILLIFRDIINYSTLFVCIQILVFIFTIILFNMVCSFIICTSPVFGILFMKLCNPFSILNVVLSSFLFN